MKGLEFKPAATKQWLKLPVAIRDRMNGRLLDFVQSGRGDVKRLNGSESARLRVGDWRVIFHDDGKTVTVVAVGHRRDIYL